MLSLRVPGKLLLAGEYAILEPGALALVLGVNRYFHAQITATKGYAITSKQSQNICTFDKPESIVLKEIDPFFRFSAHALALTSRYLLAKNSSLPSGFTLNLDAQLQQGEIKLGLGSSAAACVATVSALMALAYPNTPLEDLKCSIFKLAYLAHYQVQGSGSGADVAGCVYGSVVAYTRPDLHQLPLELSIEKIIDRPWPFLDLQPIKWPADWSLYFGWTGKSASSKLLIEDFEGWKKEDPEAVTDFFFQMQMAVMAFKQTIRDQQHHAFIQQISAQRRLLSLLNDTMIEAPETAQLHALANQAEQLGGAGKFSGAGGGDCGLAWVESTHQKALFEAWSRIGITPLDLELDTSGVQKVSL